MSEETADRALWNPQPHELHPADSWYRRCPDCGLIVQWGAHGLVFHWEVVHPGRVDEFSDWDFGLIPGNAVPLPTTRDLHLVHPERPNVPETHPDGPMSALTAHKQATAPTVPQQPRNGSHRAARPRKPQPPQEDTLF